MIAILTMGKGVGIRTPPKTSASRSGLGLHDYCITTIMTLNPRLVARCVCLFLRTFYSGLGRDYMHNFDSKVHTTDPWRYMQQPATCTLLLEVCGKFGSLRMTWSAKPLSLWVHCISRTFARKKKYVVWKHAWKPVGIRIYVYIYIYIATHLWLSFYLMFKPSVSVNDPIWR